MTSKFFWLDSAGSNIFQLRLNWNLAQLWFKRFSAELLRLLLWRPGLGRTDKWKIGLTEYLIFAETMNDDNAILSLYNASKNVFNSSTIICKIYDG